MIPSLLATVAALLIVPGQPPHGPVATLSGIVQDASGGRVPQASLELACGAVRRRTLTDRSGRFTVPDLPATACTGVVDAPGFQPHTLRVDVGDRSAPLLLTLEPQPYTTEIVVTPAQGLVERGHDVPESMSVTARRDIDARPYHLLPQVLRDEPGVLIQQTTSAQVSPMIRGFTGQGNVYLIDGVRLNTAAWRPGPSQYSGWIGAGAVDRLEILRGSGSVQYGSDALGGVVNAVVATPGFTSGTLQVTGSVDAIVGSADRSSGGATSIAVRGPRAAVRFGTSTRQVGELRGGRGVDSRAAVTRYFGLPSTIVGTRMPATGFRQTGGFAAGQVRATPSVHVNALFMHESQAGASRYDRLLGGQGLHRSGFEPQALDFGLLRVERTAGFGFDGVAATVSVNRQSDGRYEQARPFSTLDSQESSTLALGYTVKGHRRIGWGRWTVGAERYDESIDASRALTNPTTGSVAASRPDVPAGTTYSTTAGFAQVSAGLPSGRVNVRGGLRFARFRFATDPDDALGVAAETLTMQAVTYQVGAVVRVTDSLNFTAQANRGFRAANAADLSGIGLTGGGGFEISPHRAAALGGHIAAGTSAGSPTTGQPVAALGPETLYAYEAGLKYRRGGLRASANVFDLEFYDTIQRRAVAFTADIVGTEIAGFRIVRQDASGLAYIAEDVRPIAASVNLGRARIAGLETEAALDLGRWSLRTFFSIANGRLLGSGEYLRRMPPPLGGASARWTSAGGRTWIEAVGYFAGTQRRLSPGDLDDARIGALRTRASIAAFFNGTATDLGLVQNRVLVATGETLPQVQERVLGGANSGYLFASMPGFATAGLRGGLRLTPRIDLTLIGDNLLDRNYRLHGSGLDAPGAGLQARLRFHF